MGLDEITAQNTPGGLLATQRESKGLGQHAVADALKISLHRLKAIEANDFSGFPSETYAKGHLRNYARLVGLDEQQVLGLYIGLEATLSTQNHSNSNSHNESKSGSGAVVACGILIFLVLFWVVSNWFLGNFDEALHPQPHVEPTTNETLSNPDIHMQVDSIKGVEPEVLPIVESEEVTVEPETEPNGKERMAILPSEVEQEKGVEENQEIVVSRVTAAELVRTINNDQPLDAVEAVTENRVVDILRFRFENDCWLKVTDVDNEVVIAGLQSAGTDISLKGSAPFSLVIGNIEGTTLSFNGEPVKLIPKGNRKLLRLTLDNQN